MTERSSKLFTIHSYLRSNDLPIPNFGFSESLETLVDSQVSSSDENNI